MPKRDKDKRVRKAYAFLLEMSQTQERFAQGALETAVEYSAGTVRTYLSKQWKDLVKREDGLLRALPEFQLLTEDAFCELMSQRRVVFSSYRRIRYGEVLTDEFLLPLTREGLLRKALDDLFYEDSLVRRLREVGLEQIAQWLPRNKGESEEAYLRRICAFVSRMFGGYSITHVAGRYLAAPLASRTEAANNDRYIIDETTASVRFIIPIHATKVLEAASPQAASIYELIQVDAAPDDTLTTSAAARAEVALVRRLFFNLFVLAIVRLVKGEDVIWLLEEADAYRHLYVFEQSKETNGSA